MSRVILLLLCLKWLDGLILDGETGDQTGINALHVMIAEEKELRIQQVQALQERLNAVEKNQRACGCNDRTTGNPAFMAALSNDLVHCTNSQPVIFDAVKVNVGSAYNNVHGVFTAPINGTYLFTTTLSVDVGESYHIALVKNDATNEIGYLYADGINIWIQRSTTVLVHLNKGEEVWMVCLADSKLEGDKGHSWGGAGDLHTHLSGVLVSADLN